MRRFSLWLRGKPMVADALLAATLFLLEAVGLITSTQMRSPLFYAAIAPFLSIPIVWRRRYPRAVATAVFVAAMIATIGGELVGETVNSHLATLSMPIMLYTLVAYFGRLEGAVYIVAIAFQSGLSIYLFDEPLVTTALVGALIYALSWVAAEFLGARRAYDEAVEARLAVAEYDRDRRAEEAVAAERTRIARELHDVIAHGVSVMVVQADGASYAIRRDPARAEQAVANISATGRLALAELRRTVALLRTDPHADDMPLYGTAGLAKVVDMMRNAGLTVALEQTGNLDDISPAISLGVHRLVQESLTNVLRHAGATARAFVQVRRRDEDVLVEIVNSGTTGAASTSSVEGSGNGLVGMRERVAVLQGTLEAGRGKDGTWRVRAVLPLE